MFPQDRPQRLTQSRDHRFGPALLPVHRGTWALAGPPHGGLNTLFVREHRARTRIRPPVAVAPAHPARKGIEGRRASPRVHVRPVQLSRCLRTSSEALCVQAQSRDSYRRTPRAPHHG